MSKLAQKLIAQNKKTQNKTLDLGNCGLTELPPEVLECTWVETLILSSYWWEYDFKKKKDDWGKSQNEGEENQIVTLPTDFSWLLNLLMLVFAGTQSKTLSEDAFVKISEGILKKIPGLSSLVNLIKGN